MAQRTKTEPSLGTPRSGSQQGLRVRNRQLVLTTILNEGAATQSELARSTGLSQGTISSLVKELVADRVVETEAVVSSGRRATLVSLKSDAQIVVGVDVGRTHLRVATFNLRHELLGRKDFALELGHSYTQTLALAGECLTELLEVSGHDRAAILSCVVGVPVSIYTYSMSVIQGSVLPTWAGVDLREVSEQHLGTPVTLENDANLGALAHSVYDDTEAKNLVYIKIASGIGAGLVQDGRIYRSTSGLSGEIGHFQVFDAGTVCYCGNRGCLETIASTRSLVADFGRMRMNPEPTLSGLVAEVEARDPAVLRLIDDAGAALGKTLAVLANLLAPDVIVIGGPLGSAAADLLEAARVSAHRQALPAVEASTNFKVSRFKNDAELWGACALAIQIAGVRALGGGPLSSSITIK